MRAALWLLVGLLLGGLACGAFADQYNAIPAYRLGGNYPGSYGTFSSGNAPSTLAGWVCNGSAWTNFGSGTNLHNPSFSQSADVDTFSDPNTQPNIQNSVFCQFNVSGTPTWTNPSTYVERTWTCPGGGTLSGSNPVLCVSAPACAAGETRDPVTGICTAPACPSGQTSRQTYFMGYDVNGDGSPESGPFANGVVPTTMSVNGCLYDLKNPGNFQCYKYVNAPSKIYCDADFQSNGQTSPSGTLQPVTPDSADPCPSGYSSGTVNGQQRCVQSSGTQSAPTAQSTSTSSTTVNKVDNGNGTSTTTTTITNSNGTSSTIVTVTNNTTGAVVSEQRTDRGQTADAKQKIDEEGMPSGAGALNGARGELDSASQSRVDGLSTVTSSSGKDTTWGFSVDMPTGAGCQPVQLAEYSIDICQSVPTLRSVVAWIWYVTTAFLCIGMVGAAIRGS